MGNITRRDDTGETSQRPLLWFSWSRWTPRVRPRFRCAMQREALQTNPRSLSLNKTPARDVDDSQRWRPSQEFTRAAEEEQNSVNCSLFNLFDGSKPVLHERNAQDIMTLIDVGSFWMGEQSSAFHRHVKKMPNMWTRLTRLLKIQKMFQFAQIQHNHSGSNHPGSWFFSACEKKERQAPLTANIRLLPGLCWISKLLLD